MAQQPTRFESYPVDRFIEVVKAWVGHSWPITATEAQRVYESLGYAADPGDTEMFASPFAKGKADSYYVTVKDRVSTVDIAVARPCDAGEEKESAAAIAAAYTAYSHAIDCHYENMIRSSSPRDRSTAWTFDNDVELNLSVWNRSLSVRIRSPHMTQLRREEEAMGLTDYDDILEDD